ncbi:MAG: GatB/YqeY domain-containing protein, partial [Bacteroidetes bacterium]|nr:GatB/YqeY domain-containing protein [Bacteroidota bacterium]
ELAEAAVIEQFLPQQLSEAEVAVMVDKAIEATGASAMADMGKVMGMVTKEVSGRADGKTISTLVKARLSN